MLRWHTREPRPVRDDARRDSTTPRRMPHRRTVVQGRLPPRRGHLSPSELPRGLEVLLRVGCRTPAERSVLLSEPRRSLRLFLALEGVFARFVPILCARALAK